ncbi:hypothetical protein C8035_v001764 [Colletotrichum spinosum]|uniref:LysM domain-containing protein n=1 Tax=Colletotrichum spinosum TaxID=1347390 RepID=A0A4R8QQ05_9PEZI|nr:hypothetical protein C8035_v001764 [Colletotrichum spinosum]
MQSSQYSIYDDYHEEELEYVYSKCGSLGPTDIPSPIHVEEPVLAPYYVSWKRYSNVETDTCDSISNSAGMICIAAQGGTFTGVVPIPATTDAHVADGYTKEIVDPPAGAELAAKTAFTRGKWVVTASTWASVAFHLVTIVINRGNALLA